MYQSNAHAMDELYANVPFTERSLILIDSFALSIGLMKTNYRLRGAVLPSIDACSNCFLRSCARLAFPG